LAGDRDIRVGGGASVVREFLKAGLIDRLRVALTPIVLGRGIRLCVDLLQLERHFVVTSEVTESDVIHVTFSR
jgi:dihydrofolate reductase